MTQEMNHLKNNSGLTLIEILVAALIVAGGMIAYGLTTGKVTHQNAQSKKKSVAVTLAQDKIESIKNTASTVSLAGADTLDSPTESSGAWSENVGGELVNEEGATGASGSIYTRTWTITDDATLYQFYAVSVTVTWDGGSSVTLDTLISQ
jgi:Tfp pilus assembly protein PilV